jgi:small subunit ribosomal protein S18
MIAIEAEIETETEIEEGDTNMPPRGRFRRVRRVCIYCVAKFEPDYKAHDELRRLVSERGKILPRRIDGMCAKHQRRFAVEVKRARHLGLVPFVAENLK